MCTIKFASRKAPVTDPVEGGLVICTHGSRNGLDSAPVHAARIGRSGRFTEVRVGCLKGRPALPDVIASMQADKAYVVPLLMAEGHTTRHVLPKSLDGLSDPKPSVVLCRPVGCHPRLTNLIAKTARQVCNQHGWPRGECAVLIAGHGTPRNNGSRQTALRHAARMAAWGDFAEVTAGFLEESPSIPEALQAIGGRPCVVVGLFADRGIHGDADMRRLLTDAAGPAVYAGPIGTAPEIADLVVDQVDAQRNLTT